MKTCAASCGTARSFPSQRPKRSSKRAIVSSRSVASGYGGVRERNLDELLGFAGYWHFRIPPSLELLFGVESHRWNRGIATESSRCVIRYGFEILGFQTVEASTDVANAASIKVLEKLGMSFQRHAVLDGLDTIFYALRFDEWQKLNPASARGNAPSPGSGA
jgi:RimJ/RimL family protein N-acetyltransferase